MNKEKSNIRGSAGARSVVNSSISKARTKLNAPDYYDPPLEKMALPLIVCVGACLFAFFKGGPEHYEFGYCALGSLFVIGGSWLWIMTCYDFKKIRDKAPPENVFCASCGKHIQGNLGWVCGYCDKPLAMGSSSFLEACPKCGKEPVSIECPTCRVLNLVAEGVDLHHPARAKSGERKADWGAVFEKIDVLFPVEDRLMLRDNELRVTEKETELTAAKQRLENLLQRGKEKSSARPGNNKREASYQRDKEQNSEISEIVERELRIAEEKYANNPQRLEREKLRIKTWAANELGEV